MQFIVDIPQGQVDLIARRFGYEAQIHDVEAEKYVDNPESKGTFVARQVQSLITREANHQTHREAEVAAKKIAAAASKKSGGVKVTVKE